MEGPEWEPETTQEVGEVAETRGLVIAEWADARSHSTSWRGISETAAGGLEDSGGTGWCGRGC